MELMLINPSHTKLSKFLCKCKAVTYICNISGVGQKYTFQANEKLINV